MWICPRWVWWRWELGKTRLYSPDPSGSGSLQSIWNLSHPVSSNHIHLFHHVKSRDRHWDGNGWHSRAFSCRDGGDEGFTWTHCSDSISNQHFSQTLRGQMTYATWSYNCTSHVHDAEMAMENTHFFTWFCFLLASAPLWCIAGK